MYSNNKYAKVRSLGDGDKLRETATDVQLYQSSLSSLSGGRSSCHGDRERQKMGRSQMTIEAVARDCSHVSSLMHSAIGTINSIGLSPLQAISLDLPHPPSISPHLLGKEGC